jgi:hypothetical protein
MIVRSLGAEQTSRGTERLNHQGSVMMAAPCFPSHGSFWSVFRERNRIAHPATLDLREAPLWKTAWPSHGFRPDISDRHLPVLPEKFHPFRIQGPCFRHHRQIEHSDFHVKESGQRWGISLCPRDETALPRQIHGLAIQILSFSCYQHYALSEMPAKFARICQCLG